LKATVSVLSYLSTRIYRSASSSVVVPKLADYLELTKPRIAILALCSVVIGFFLASGFHWSSITLIHALIGISLVATSSSALNQLLERETDARMERTANRPLPAGRLHPVEVLILGFASGLLGIIYLAFFVNSLTALLSGLTLLFYVAIYTPLKRIGTFCTIVGAVPGALPPVLGWTAAGGPLDQFALTIFAILFVWQFPHFLAIGSFYHADYHRAGLKMWLGEKTTGRVAVGYAIVMLPVSLLPTQLGMAGDFYALIAILLGAIYLVMTVKFMAEENRKSARQLILTSLVYLPLLLATLLFDYFQLIG